MHALDVQPTSSIRVIVDGNEATDHPELVFTVPTANGDVFGEVALAADWPIARHVTLLVFGHEMPSSVIVVVGYSSPMSAPSSYWKVTSEISASITVMGDWLESACISEGLSL